MNVPTGYTALDMIGFTDKGVYNSATAYVKNDIVHYNGNLWKCLVDDTTAVTPAEGASWTVFLAEPTSAAEDIIATVEPSVVSTHQYTAGKQLILNDILYTVTAAVNIGDTLAVGTNIVASDTIVEQLTTKANTSSLATVATSGSYADLSNKPTLGTAAAKDVPASGNASTTEVVMGDDTRLSNDRNAADVYPWAKAANKPIYNGSEINTSAAQTGTAQSAVAATIASGTSMDAAIGDLLDNDVTINTDIVNVKQALTDEVEARAILNTHNILPFPFENMNGTYSDVPFSVDSEAKITASGTIGQYGLNFYVFKQYTRLPKGSYKIKFYGTLTNCILRLYDEDTSTTIGDITTSNGYITFTIDASNVGHKLWLYFNKGAGQTIAINGGIVLSVADDKFDGYTKPTPTNAELLSADANAELGAHNVLRFPTLEELKARNTVGAWVNNVYTLNGIVFTVNDNSVSIYADGTQANRTSFALYNRLDSMLVLDDGDYILNGCVNGSTSTYTLLLNATDKNSSSEKWYAYNNTGDTPFTFDSTAIKGCGLTISVQSGVAVNNVVIKPMIRRASDPSTKFTPYAKTNRELTESVTVEDYSSQVVTVAEEVSYNQWSSQVLKMGNLLQINIVLSTSSAIAANTVLFTLPSALLSLRNSAYRVIPSTDIGKGVIINPINGNISITEATTAAIANARICCTYII